MSYSRSLKFYVFTLHLFIGYLTALSYQQQEQVAVDRQSANISIPCNLGLQGTKPFWIINGFVYDVFSIPYAFPAIPVVKSYSSLTIPLVTTDFNGTTFQCAINTENGVIFGRSTRIKVVSSTFRVKSRGAEDPPPLQVNEMRNIH